MADKIKYLEISKNLKHKIYSNFYKPNSILPSEKDLCADFNVSRITMRKAISDLVASGILYTTPGKGTFVCGSSQNNYVTEIQNGIFFAHGYTSAKLIFANVAKPDIYEVYNLSVSPDEKIISIKWVINRDETTIAYDIKSIPYLSGIPIDESNLGYSSLIEILSQKYLSTALKMKATFSTVNSNEEISRVMGFPINSIQQVVQVQIWVLNRKNETLGWNTIYIKCEEFKLEGETV